MSLAACGGGGGTTTTTPPPAALSGVFIDSAVSGFRYATTTHSGSTDQDGTFMYAAGESVTFSISDIAFPAVAAASLLSSFDADVANLIANSGSVNTMLVDANAAITHLQASIMPGSGCTTNHAMVGWMATLSTFGHNVSGQATIIDDCTIRINNFNYDGGGLPDVLIYAGLNGDFGSGMFAPP